MQADLYGTEGTSSNKIKVNLISGKLNNLKKDVVNNMTMDRFSIDNMTMDRFSIEKPYDKVNADARIQKY